MLHICFGCLWRVLFKFPSLLMLQGPRVMAMVGWFFQVGGTLVCHCNCIKMILIMHSNIITFMWMFEHLCVFGYLWATPHSVLLLFVVQLPLLYLPSTVGYVTEADDGNEPFPMKDQILENRSCSVCLHILMGWTCILKNNRLLSESTELLCVWVEGTCKNIISWTDKNVFARRLIK